MALNNEQKRSIAMAVWAMHQKGDHLFPDEAHQAAQPSACSPAQPAQRTLKDRPMKIVGAESSELLSDLPEPPQDSRPLRPPIPEPSEAELLAISQRIQAAQAAWEASGRSQPRACLTLLLSLCEHSRKQPEPE